MVYMYHNFLIHSSAEGCFHVLAIINSAVMNIGVHVSLSDMVSLVCMPSNGIAGSYGSSNSRFFCFVLFCFVFYYVKPVIHEEDVQFHSVHLKLLFFHLF